MWHSAAANTLLWSHLEGILPPVKWLHEIKCKQQAEVSGHSASTPACEDYLKLSGATCGMLSKPELACAKSSLCGIVGMMFERLQLHSSWETVARMRS